MIATGNSFAAPHMAGIIALLLEEGPDLSPFEVKAVLAGLASEPYPEVLRRGGRRRRRRAEVTPDVTPGEGSEP
jgi:subtilisin family serine protease